MRRLARLDAPGVLHHVIIRGIEPRPGVVYAVRRGERIANERAIKFIHWLNYFLSLVPLSLRLKSPLGGFDRIKSKRTAVSIWSTEGKFL